MFLRSLFSGFVSFHHMELKSNVNTADGHPVQYAGFQWQGFIAEGFYLDLSGLPLIQAQYVVPVSGESNNFYFGGGKEEMLIYECNWVTSVFK